MERLGGIINDQLRTDYNILHPYFTLIFRLIIVAIEQKSQGVIITAICN